MADIAAKRYGSHFEKMTPKDCVTLILHSFLSKRGLELAKLPELVQNGPKRTTYRGTNTFCSAKIQYFPKHLSPVCNNLMPFLNETITIT